MLITRLHISVVIFQWCSHGIYKWQERAQRNARPRATSLIVQPTTHGPAFENIHQPGGFRRNYVLLRAEEQGLEEPRVTESFIGARSYQSSSAMGCCTNVPLDFLFLYGHFAGEDLEESDEEESDEDEVSGPMPVEAGSSQPTPTQSILRRGDTQRTVGPRTQISPTQSLLQRPRIDEETPLLITDTSVSRMRKRSLSRSRRNARSSHGPHHGGATITQAILMASTTV